MDKATNHTNSDPEVTQEQRDRLLELVAQVAEGRRDVNWADLLDAKLRDDYRVDSYSDLNGRQMDDLLAFLAAELAQLCPRAKGRAELHERLVLLAIEGARAALSRDDWRAVLDDLGDVIAAEWGKLLPDIAEGA